MFDASKSSIKDSNVTKFDWDFGDGIKQEWVDAVIPWHKYIKAWEYDIKVTITSQDWKSYSTTKKLVLKETPSKVKITTSMKRAPVGQWIDFSSASSEWQIASYYWDFWDGDISTLPNVSHAFNTPWKYKVTLRLEFTNRNVLTESAEIEIY
jgi:PKD repeat protein